MKAFSISEMIANIVFSLFYMGVLKLQLTGVLLGTITSTVLTVMWQDPYIIFHHAFHSSVKPYFKRYLYNLLIIALELIMIFKLNEFLPANLWAHFFALLGLVILIGLAMPLVFYWRTTEFKYVLLLLNKFLQRR